jgi:hypothetical protein
MRLRVEVLESRNCAALVDLAALPGGMLRAFDGTPFTPFPDFPGPVHGVFSPATGLGKVAPGEGGGPRVETVDAHGVRQGNDVYADGLDPASRAGVVFVGVDDTPAPPAPMPVAAPGQLPQLTEGAGRLTVYVDFTRPWSLGLIDAAYVRRAVDTLAAIEAPLDVTVTTAYPAMRPGEYLTAVVLTTGVVPWSPEAGGIEVQDLYRHTDLYLPDEVFVGFAAGPDTEAHLIAHEAGHAAGLRHVGTPGNLMNPYDSGNRLDAGQVAEANRQIDDFVTGIRFGVYVDTDRGASVYRLGRFELLDNAHPDRGGFPAA